MRLNIDGKEFETEIEPGTRGYSVKVLGRRVTTLPDGPLVKAGSETYEIRLQQNPDGTYNITTGQDTYQVRQVSEKSCLSHFLKAPMQGIINAIKVKEGDAVSKGQPLVKLMSMKMENEILSEKDCKIKHINIRKNQRVSKDEVLIEFEK